MQETVTFTLPQLALAIALTLGLGAVLYRAYLTVTGTRAIRRHLALVAQQDATGKPWPVNAAGHPRRRASDKAEDLIAEVERDVRRARECR